MCQALQEMQAISRTDGLAKGELQKVREVTKNLLETRHIFGYNTIRDIQEGDAH